MAVSLTPFRPAPAIRAASSKQPDRRKPAWWTPLFGWSSEPAYLADGSAEEPKRAADPPAGSRFPRPGCFTEEKAKQLRRKTAEGKTFHDVMYHSAIASRLASDVPERFDDAPQ